MPYIIFKINFIFKKLGNLITFIKKLGKRCILKKCIYNQNAL